MGIPSWLSQVSATVFPLKPVHLPSNKTNGPFQELALRQDFNFFFFQIFITLHLKHLLPCLFPAAVSRQRDEKWDC